MDLASFIPGILTTAPFSPGATTPAPYNVNHVGTTDGTGPLDSSANVAEIYNRLLLQIASTIDHSGIGIDNNNWAQLPFAVQQIAQNVVDASLGAGVVTTAQYNADFYGSFGPNGYYFMKGGLLLQWGVAATPPASFPAFFTTTFPIAFPNTAFQIYGTMQSLANLDTGQNVHETEARLSAKTQTNATWLHDYVGDASFGWGGVQRPQLYWFAIGN